MFRSLSKSKKQKVHFLHIGKTGGSALKYALKDCLETPEYSIELHKHTTSLKHIRRRDYAVFFLRDPISRFISAFYSRQRKGKPKYNAEWNRKEREIFEHFATPNDIAVALAEREPLAMMAMKSVLHFQPYKKWYISFDYFKSRLDDILFVGFQETLNFDFVKLKQLLELPENVELPTDAISAHRNPYVVDKLMDDKGVAALKEWYSEDIRFVSFCRDMMSYRRETNRHLQAKSGSCQPYSNTVDVD